MNLLVLSVKQEAAEDIHCLRKILYCAQLRLLAQDDHIRQIVISVVLRDLHECAVRDHLVQSLHDLVSELLVAELECDRILLCGDGLIQNAELIGIVTELIARHADIDGDRLDSARLQILEAGVVTEAVENCIEANILMSGLGYQNTGCSVAHAVNAGLTELEESAPYLHGERVGFGVLVQFVFENRSKDEIGDLVRFMAATGLPLTLEEVGVDYTKSDRIDIMVDKIVYHNGTIYSEPLFVNETTVRSAILGADAIGRAYRSGKQLF